MLESTIKNARATYAYLWRVLSSRYPYGKSIFSEDWDLLVILDGCRVDALQEVQSEYDFIDNVESITSLGSTTKEWIDNTFINQYRNIIQNTAYITANGYSFHIKDDTDVDPLDMFEIGDTLLEGADSLGNFINNKTISGELAYFESARTVVRKNGVKNELSREVFPPDLLTNQAITAGREQPHDRMIVHYMQPHAPFIRSALSRGEFKEYEAHPFRYLKNGGNMEVVWEAYLDNLRFALDHVGRLIDNYDGERTVITADHGDLFGEWGLYSHNCGILHPNLRRVPWVETTATDRKSSNPDNILEGYETIDNDTMTVDDRLDALGYR